MRNCHFSTGRLHALLKSMTFDLLALHAIRHITPQRSSSANSDLTLHTGIQWSCFFVYVFQKAHRADNRSLWHTGGDGQPFRTACGRDNSDLPATEEGTDPKPRLAPHTRPVQLIQQRLVSHTVKPLE